MEGGNGSANGKQTVSKRAAITVVAIVLGLAIIALITFVAVRYSKIRARASGAQTPSAAIKRKWPSVRVWNLPSGITRAVVSERPVLDILRGFLSSQEADELVALAKGRFKRSHTVEAGTGIQKPDPARTSSSVYLEKSETPLVTAVEQRAAAVVGLPASFLERLQVVKYEAGEFYKQHHDYLPNDTPDVKTNGQRTTTLFVYLNDLPESETGGGTHFVHLNTTIRPEKGAAAMWFNVDKDGNEDTRTLHAGETINNPSTVKYGLNVWFRDRPQSQ